MSEEEAVVVSAEEWNKLQRRRTKLVSRLASVTASLQRLQAQVDADNHSFAVAALIERRKRKQAESDLAALQVIADEQRKQLRALRRRNVKRKIDFNE